MTALTSAEAVADWLRGHVRRGEGLRYPYARKWEIAGCSPTDALWYWPSDRVTAFADGLIALARPLAAGDDGVLIDGVITVAVNRSNPGDGPPDAYVMEVAGDGPYYVGNSPEVVLALISGVESPVADPTDEVLQVGFPGRPPGDITYVGSWQWDIHGEAWGAESVRRAAAATLAAIAARRGRQ